MLAWYQLSHVYSLLFRLQTPPELQMKMEMTEKIMFYTVFSFLVKFVL